MAVHAGRAVFEVGIDDPRGNRQVGALAYVYLRGTTTLATLYTDRTKATAEDNPVATNGLGNLAIFADPGDYDAVINGATLRFTVLPDWEDVLLTATPEAGLPAHLADAVDAHDASAVSFSPAAGIASMDVQAALVELAGDVSTDVAGLASHLGESSDAHDASSVSVVPVGGLAATDVQAALAELDSEKQATIPPGTYAKTQTPGVELVAASVDDLTAEGVARASADALKANDNAVVKLTGDQTVTGTKNHDAIRIKSERFDIRHPAWAGALDGVANNLTAINAIQASALSSNGGEIYFGPGVAGLGGAGVLLTRSMRWKGEGMWVSTVKSLAGATGMVGSSGADWLEFEDLCFDGSDLITTMFIIGGNRHRTVRFRRCRFTGIGTGTAISAAQAQGYEFIDCLAEAPGTGDGRFLLVQSGGGRHRVRGCKVRYLREGIIVDNGSSTSAEEQRVDFLTVDDFDCDLGWWLLKAAFSGSGGTVSYTNPSGTQVVITDTAAAFTGITTAAGSETNVRVMPVRSTGTHNAVNTFITGTGFNASGIKRGDIVRCGTAFAVVMGIQSDTVVMIEEWLDQTTYRPVAPPTTGTAWTVYGALIGRVASFTGTTVTIDRLHDVDGTTVLAPASGTLYEVMMNRPNYPFQCERGTYGARVINSTFRRGWSDQIAFQGSSGCSVSNTTVADGQDMGLTLDTNSEDCSVQNVLALHNGAGGIYVRGDGHVIVGNRGIDNHWQNSGNLLGDFNIVGLTNGLVVANRARRKVSTMALATYGFIARAGGSGTRIAQNRADGHATAGYRMESDSGAHEWRDNKGTYSVAGSVAHTWGTQEGTGSPEAVVFGSIGDTYRRRDGGAGTSTYVKESGNGTTTGWVAK